MVFNCCIRAIWIRNWIFWHQQDHWGVFSGNQFCLMGWAGGWSWQRETGSNQTFERSYCCWSWGRILVVSILSWPHSRPQRWEMRIHHEKKSSCKNPAHILLKGHILMEQEGKRTNPEHTQHTWIISWKPKDSGVYIQKLGFPCM